MLEVDLSGPISTRASAVAAVATSMCLEDVVKGRVSYLLLMTFRGSTGKVWQLHQVTHVDDVVRTIARRESAEALAFVYSMAPPPGVEAQRAYNVSAETFESRHDSLIGLMGGEGLGGTMYRLFARPLPPKDYRWLGVPPVVDVDIWVEGIVGMVGPKGEA
jgi:hypothetical protein